MEKKGDTNNLSVGISKKYCFHNVNLGKLVYINISIILTEKYLRDW